jgi:ribonucleotide reductase alpha subunit
MKEVMMKAHPVSVVTTTDFTSYVFKKSKLGIVPLTVPSMPHITNQDYIQWLSGLIDCNGTITPSGIEIHTTKARLNYLEELMKSLQAFGIHNTITPDKDSSLGYVLHIDKANTEKLIQEGLQLIRKADELDKVQVQVTINNIVTTIEDNNEVEATYCGTTDSEEHMLMFNGVLASNCTEIFQNTEPDTYLVALETDSNTTLYFNEYDEVDTKSGVKKAKDITSIDLINVEGKFEKVMNHYKEKIDGQTAVCNLASINLSKINSDEDIKRVVPIAIRILDNVIDLNFYPLDKVRKTNRSNRAIGLGIMGEAQMVAEKSIYFGSHEHKRLIDHILEHISYRAIEASSDLAKEKFSYPNFNISEWVKESTYKKYKRLDGKALYEKVKAQGMRNGYLMAIAPTSSISILVGTTQAIEPVYKRKWYEENLSGVTPVTAPNLSPDTWQYYTPAYEVDQFNLIELGGIRQYWIDQGQSLNIFMSLDKVNGKLLNDLYMRAWKLGLKSTYYLRAESPEALAEPDVVDRSIECTGCQ